MKTKLLPKFGWPLAWALAGYFFIGPFLINAGAPEKVAPAQVAPGGPRYSLVAVGTNVWKVEHETGRTWKFKEAGVQFTAGRVFQVEGWWEVGSWEGSEARARELDKLAPEVPK